MSDNDPLERLRRAAGTSDKPKVVVGAIGPGTWDERRQEHEEYMKFLHEAGSDPKGHEALEKGLRRLRR